MRTWGFAAIAVSFLLAAALSAAESGFAGQAEQKATTQERPAAEALTETVTAAPASAASSDDAKFYDSEVRPILEARCYACHGAAPGGDNKSGFSLVTCAGLLRGGENGPALDAENLEASAIVRAINYDGLEMPPKGKLARSQIDVLTRWVKMGAPWSAAPPTPRRGSPPVDDAARNFWSFRRFTRPTVPAVKDSAWVRTPLDAFILAKLEEKGLSPAPPAAKSSLLRRLYYDLIGLPPSVADVDAFLADDSPEAYEQVVDRLLASPRYGERWARHWLDLVRYAETDGYEFDQAKPDVWRFRDYVIHSLNDDKPYDVFLREQLAGDELSPPTADSIVATGFYKLGIHDGGAPDKLQAEFDELDDVVATTSQVFLGLTMNCARCHDHKIDPIPTRDYYRLLAFFRGIQGERKPRSLANMVDTGNTAAKTKDATKGANNATGKAKPQPIPINDKEIAAYEKSLAALTARLHAIEEPLEPLLSEGQKGDFEVEEYRPPIVRAHVPNDISPDTWEHYATLLRKRDELEKNRPAGLASALCVSEDGPTPPATHVLLRGSPYAEGDEVEPGFPIVVTFQSPTIPAAAPEAQSSGRRTVLAQWMIDRDNPLTARVIANRLWQYHFGRGIVRTPNDFGFGGSPPTHPELLDWLASELVDGGWRLKRIHKLIVTSNAYQMSSATSAAGEAKDPDNDSLWHFDVRRLEAEEIRDSILAVTGNLNLKMGGPSIYPHIVDEVKAGQSRPGEGWVESTPEEAARRTVYVHIKRSLVMPLTQVYDAADTDASCPVRFASTQPTQALSMINGPFLNEQAAIFARDVRKQAGDDVTTQVTLALHRATQRTPTAAEVDRGVKLIERLQTTHGLSPDAALASFCLVALNLNEFMYLD